MKKNHPPIDWTQLKPQPLIGVDEVGRGCLAGPVFSAAVFWSYSSKDSEKMADYPDSKQISPEERKKQALKIKSQHIYAVSMVSVQEIARLNILQASLLSMKKAVMACCSKLFKQSLPERQPQQIHVLVDGNFLIPHLSSFFYQTAFIKGDQRLSPIASASIVAKVARDKWISQQDSKYPQYGFAQHKGYATKQHKKAIAQYGPCPLHRKYFSGVKEYL